MVEAKRKLLFHVGNKLMKSDQKPPALRFWAKYFAWCCGSPCLHAFAATGGRWSFGSPKLEIAWLVDGMWSTALTNFATWPVIQVEVLFPAKKLTGEWGLGATDNTAAGFCYKSSIVFFCWNEYLQTRYHADASVWIGLAMYLSPGLGAAWHRKHGGEIWCSNGCWNSPERLSLGGIRPQWRLLHDLLLKVICSVRKEKHKSQNTEIAALKKSEWPKYQEKILRHSSHFLSYMWLCGSRRLEGDREIKLLVNQGHCVYKHEAHPLCPVMFILLPYKILVLIC